MSAQVAAPAPAPTYPFTVPLPYPYEALEPHIDAATMHLHHDQHHQAYVDQLNAALQDHPAWQTLSIGDILGRLDQVPEAIRAAVRDQGGGHANHALLWQVLAPGRGGRRPNGVLAAALIDAFGSFDAFKEAFSEAGLSIFGSGWVFLVCGAGCEPLEIITLPNQDRELPQGKHVLLGNNVWEHAYYLNYQHRRADYLAAWWHVVNWDYVAQRLAAFKAGADAPG